MEASTSTTTNEVWASHPPENSMIYDPKMLARLRNRENPKKGFDLFQSHKETSLEILPMALPESYPMVWGVASAKI